MLYLDLWQTTWSIIWSIQLKELHNNILHIQFKNFVKIRALCCLKVRPETTQSKNVFRCRLSSVCLIVIKLSLLLWNIFQFKTCRKGFKSVLKKATFGLRSRWGWKVYGWKALL